MRRYFVGAATTQYAPATNLPALPELVDELARATAMFTDLGYEVVPGFGVNMTSFEFTDRLRAFLRSGDRRADDVIVVYYTGHGEVTATGTDLLLPMADATDDRSYSFLHAGDLTGRLLNTHEPGEMTSQQLLFVLDTCYSGAAGGSLTAGAVSFINRLRGTASGPAVAVIVSARDYQRAGVGTFTGALARAVQERAIAGHEVRFVPLEPLIAQVNKEMAGSAPDTVVRQHARMLYVGERASEFFPNKQYDQWYSGLDVRTRDLRLQHEARRRDRDEAAITAQGLTKGVGRSDLWLFTGRHAALRKAVGWLAGSGRSTMVVTGGPGSGKSALLARLDTLADPSRIARVPGVHLLPPDTIPAPESINRFIHARGLTPLGLLAALAEACGIEDIAAVDTPGKLVARLRDRTEPVTVVIDGVDEAAGEPGDSTRAGIAIAEQVLAPIVGAGDRTPLRLLLGTRSHLISALGSPVEVVNLDRAGYADRPSLHRYVQTCLTELVETSPYRAQPPEYLGAVVDAVAAAAGDSFLVALITARSLALREQPVADPYDEAWRAALPREAADAMSQDLSYRLGPEAARARDLLLPLAYAQASGLPWEDVWPRLVTDLTSRRCGNDDIDWLIENAGYYVIETRLGRLSAYRLYHAALAAHLCAGRDPKADHAVIVGALIDRVPKRHDGTNDWGLAHPYTMAAIASHAAHADRLDGLLAQPRLLTETPVGPLLNALPSVSTPRARAIADAYRRAAGHMHANPAERAAYLQLAARCARAPHLADDITTSGLPLPWTTHWASWRLQPPHTTLTWHKGPVTAVAFGDLAGRPLVASASFDWRVRLWDAATGRPFGEPLVGHTDWVTSVAFGQLDNRLIVVSGGTDRTVRLWDVATARPVAGQPIRYRGPVRSVAIGNMDGRQVIVAAGDDELVMVWDPATGQALGVPCPGHPGGTYTVAIGALHGQAVLASGGADSTVRLWEASTGRQVGEAFTGHSGRVRSVAFGRLGDETIVVSAGEDNTVQIWSADTGQLRADPYTGHEESVNSIAFGRRGTQPVVISGSTDQTVQMWDVVTGSLIGARFTGHTGSVRTVAFGTRDGRPVIVSGGDDETVRLWDAASGEPVGEPFTGHTATVNAVTFGALAGQPVVASGSDDRTVRLWDAASGQPVGQPITGHTDAVTTVAFGTRDGQPVLASGSDDETVRLWNAATGEPVGEPLDSPDGARSVAFGIPAQPSVIAAGGEDETVRLWDTASGQPVGPLIVGHEAAVNALAFGEIDGRPVVASASEDHTIRLWDTASGRQLEGSPLTGHTASVTTVAFGVVDGQPVLASGSDDETIRLWDAQSGQPLGEPLPGPGAVRSVAFGHLGRQPVIVAGGSGPSVQVTDAASGEPVAALFAGSGGVRSVTFGHLGRQPVIIAGGTDNALRAWDAATGHVVAAPFTGHKSPVTAVAFGRLDGALVVVSGSTDHTVRLWDAGSGRPLAVPFAGHSASVRSVAFGQAGGRAIVVSGSDDRTVRAWDAATGEPFGPPFIGHRSAVNSVAFGQLAGRSVIVSGSNDHTVQIWDAASHELIRSIDAHHGYVNAVAFGQLDGSPVVVSGGNDHVVRLWDAGTGELLGVALTGHSDDVNSVAMGEQGGRVVVVSGGNDGKVMVWDAATSEPTGPPFAEHEGWVRAVALGRLGNRAVVVSGGIDHTLSVRPALPDQGNGDPGQGTRIRLNATINCIAVRDASHLVIGTDLGLVSIRLPG